MSTDTKISTEEVETMQIAKSNTRGFCITCLILLSLLVWVLGSALVATADYGDSAHGNTSDGVNRAGTGYPTGYCAHCHDALNDSICGANPLMLFTDVFVTIGNQFCVQCHSAVVEYQPVTNYPYCVNFGGYTPAYYGHIKKQIINDHSTPEYCGSRHNMKRIRNYIKNDTNGWGFVWC